MQNPDLASYFLIPHRSTCLYHDCFFNKGLSTSTRGICISEMFC